MLAITPYEEAVAGYDMPVKKRLGGWKSNSENGFDAVLRSQVHHDRSYDSVWDEANSHLLASDVGPIVMSFEKADAEKIGPMSVQLPWESERKKNARDFFTQDRSIDPDPESWAFAVRMLRRLLPPSSLTPLTPDDALARLPKGTNKGLPMFSRDRGHLSSYLHRANEAVRGGTVEIEPYIAGWRGQPGGRSRDDVKQRLLNMADGLDGILSAMYFHPALDALRADPKFAAWSNTPRVEEVLLRVLVIARAADVAVVSTDFTNFDASVPMIILDVIFDALRLWFTDTPGLDLLQESFTSGGLLCPDGLYTGRLGAIPSGSGLTGFMGTMVNIFCAIYVAHRAGSSILASTYLGDDAVNVYRPNIDEDRIQEFGSELNLDLNADKQYVAKTSAHYLQYVFELEGDRLRNGGGVRTFGRNLQGMLNYERRRRNDEWTPSMASIRTIMQLENSLRHPEFPWLVKFAAQGDRRLIELPVSRLVEESGGTSNIIEVLGIASYRYGSRNVSGLEAFETVKVLDSLR